MLRHRCRVRRPTRDVSDVYGPQGTAATTEVHTELPCLVWPQRSEIRTEDGERIEVSDYMAVIENVDIQADDLLDQLTDRAGTSLGFPELRVHGSGERWQGAFIRLRLISRRA